MPKVSVIIPVYGVEKYIERCARSIFEQTLDSLEILFINDCTLDNSVAIIERTLKEYPTRRENTRIINLPANTGQAGVRRQGIIEATGSYVIHCDGDDWVDKDLYEVLYRKAVETGVDIVVSDIVMEYDNHTVARTIKPLPSDGKEIMRNWYCDTLGMFCWNKLVRRTLYTDNSILPWIGLNMWEDNGLFARLFYYARKVAQIHGPVYHYNRANMNAMTAGYGMKQVEQMIGIAQNLADFYESKADAAEFTNTVNAFKFLAKLNLITTRYDGLRDFHQLFPESNQVAQWISLNAFSTKGKIRFLFVKYHLSWLFVTLFKIKNLLVRKIRV